MRHQAGIALLSLALTAGAARADIVIGLAGPMTGEFATLGEQMQMGAAQAVADINEAGGVNGQHLVLEVADDGCAARKADTVANDLARKGAVMVVGHLCLKASIAGAAVYAAEHIIQISPGTTFGKFTDASPGPGIFRLVGRDDAQGAFAGAMIASRYPDKTVAVVDDRTAYGSALANAAVAAMTAAGKEPNLRDAYDPGGKDYVTLVARLQANVVDVLYLGGSDPEAAMIARELRKRDMTTTIVAADSLLEEDYGSRAGDAADGTLVSYAIDPRTSAPASIIAKFSAKQIDPAGYTLPAYAAVQAWAQAAAVAGSSDFDKVITTLHGGPFNTAIGPVAFDEKGDLRNPRYEWYVWRGGGYMPEGM